MTAMMKSTTATLKTQERRMDSAEFLKYLPILGLLALALALAALGAFQAAGAISDGLKDGRSFEVGQSIPTSFGSLTVGNVEKLDGLSSQDLAGVTHGIQNLVSDDKVQLQVSLQLVNRSTGPAAYSPGQFRLVGDGEQAAVLPASGTLLTGQLPARSSIDAEIDFVAPRTNLPLWIEYSEPGRAQPARIAIGPADPKGGPVAPEPSHAH